MRLVLTANSSDTLALQVLGNVAGKQKVIGAKAATFSFKANQLYHIAWTFEPQGEGLTVGKLYIEEGDVPIVPGTTKPLLETAPIRLDPDDAIHQSFVSGFGHPGLNIGDWNAAPASATIDFDRFRVWNEVPKEFDAPGKAD